MSLVSSHIKNHTSKINQRGHWCPTTNHIFAFSPDRQFRSQLFWDDTDFIPCKTAHGHYTLPGSLAAPDWIPQRLQLDEQCEHLGSLGGNNINTVLGIFSLFFGDTLAEGINVDHLHTALDSTRKVPGMSYAGFVSFWLRKKLSEVWQQSATDFDRANLALPVQEHAVQRVNPQASQCWCNIPLGVSPAFHNQERIWYCFCLLHCYCAGSPRRLSHLTLSSGGLAGHPQWSQPTTTPELQRTSPFPTLYTVYTITEGQRMPGYQQIVRLLFNIHILFAVCSRHIDDPFSW